MGKARSIRIAFMLVFPFWERLLPGRQCWCGCWASILGCTLAVCFIAFLVSHPIDTGGEDWV